MPESRPTRWALPAHLAALFTVAFNDNATKVMLIALVGYLLEDQQEKFLTAAVSALLVAPFILFSPLAGWMSDRFSKQRILWAALLLQLLAFLLLALTVTLKSLPLAIAAFFLIAAQSAFYSPAKQGILKELAGSARLGVAVGWMEMLNILAILIGTLSGVLFDRAAGASGGDPWAGARAVSSILVGVSVLALIAFLPVPRTPEQSHRRFHLSLLWEHFTQLRTLWSVPNLRRSALGIAWFFSLGTLVYLLVFELGKELHHGAVGSSHSGSIMMLCLGAGIAVGSLIAAALCRGRIELGILPVAGLGMPLCLLGLALLPPATPVYFANLVFFGATGALFVVPLTAFFQDQACDESRGDAIAACNLIVNIGCLAASALFFALVVSFHLTPRTFFGLLALAALAVSIYLVWLLPASLLRLSGILFTKLLYRIRVTGSHHLPPTGPVLLVPNHVTYADAVILQAACPRPIRFMAHANFEKAFFLGWALRTLDVIFISPTRAKDAIGKAVDALQAGSAACIFPEGGLTQTGELQKLQKGFELIARRADCPVIPVCLDKLWGSVFSFEGGRYFWKLPRRLPYPVEVRFGPPLAPQEATVDTVTDALRTLKAAAPDPGDTDARA